MEQVKVRLLFRCNVRATHNGLGSWEKTKEIGPLKVFKTHGQGVPAK
jgi:hypothetical protein